MNEAEIERPEDALNTETERADEAERQLEEAREEIRALEEKRDELKSAHLRSLAVWNSNRFGAERRERDMSDLHDARVDAAAKAMYGRDFDRSKESYPDRPNFWAKYRPAYAEHAALALAAADAVVTVDGLQERIEDTLAYYQCRETNPKADHPYMGYHAFSEEQREWLRAKKSEAASEIVRMILALLRGGGEQ